MVKIVDSFLFFQELDLLEIRLAYLYEKVDKFIILEACQTFTGKPKLFNFENNKSRFEKYLDKIIYFKLEDQHQSYESVIEFLANQNTKAHRLVLDIMQSHTHYPKDGLHWVLDTYHRESLHLAYSAHLEDDDVLFLSDLDEIPNISIFDELKTLKLEKPIVCKQHEFMYFLNYYNNSDWLGTIFGKYADMKDKSLNLLRMDSKEVRDSIDKIAYSEGGYHFTTIGSIEMIKRKIQSWGHQEFNTKNIIKRLQYNIDTGQDIFEREYGTKMKKVSFADRAIFDEKMATLIAKYPDLTTQGEIKYVGKDSLYNLYRKYSSKVYRVFSRLVGQQ